MIRVMLFLNISSFWSLVFESIVIVSEFGIAFNLSVYSLSYAISLEFQGFEASYIDDFISEGPNSQIRSRIEF